MRAEIIIDPVGCQILDSAFREGFADVQGHFWPLGSRPTRFLMPRAHLREFQLEVTTHAPAIARLEMALTKAMEVSTA